jgi:prepilin peptidase CpaA
MLERLPLIVQILLAAVCLIAGYYDILYRRIPNWLTLPTVLVGLVLSPLLSLHSSPWRGLADAAIGVGLAMLINFPLYLLHARGAGDVKLMAAIGALVGWRAWIAIFIVSSLLGGVLAVVLMLAKGRFRKTIWNIGYIIAEIVHFRAPHLRSEELDVARPTGLRLPQGAVIALGCFALLGLQAILT